MKLLYIQKKILYVTAEIFTNEIINTLRNGRNASIEEFFHTFNDLQSKGKQIVLTSDRPPKELDNISERMKSRFVMGLIQELMLPDYEARLTIVKKRAEQCNLSLDEEVLRYIATNIKSNIRELSGDKSSMTSGTMLSLLIDTLSLLLVPTYVPIIISKHAATTTGLWTLRIFFWGKTASST